MSSRSPSGDAPRPARAKGRRRSLPRPLRLVGALLLALLGFALAASVHSQRKAAALATARPDDLVRILDDLDSRAGRLREQIADLQRTRERLSGTNAGAAALAEARTRTQDLGILAGTVAAQGPGIVLTITDSQAQVGADVMVDVIEELRDAGAETMEVSGMRIGATSWFANPADGAGGLTVEGRHIDSPYVVRAIGDPATMERALQIPGGIVDTVRATAGAKATIATESHLEIRSLRQPVTPRYAQPAHG